MRARDCGSSANRPASTFTATGRPEHLVAGPPDDGHAAPAELVEQLVAAAQRLPNLHRGILPVRPGIRTSSATRMPFTFHLHGHSIYCTPAPNVTQGTHSMGRFPRRLTAKIAAKRPPEAERVLGRLAGDHRPARPPTHSNHQDPQNRRQQFARSADISPKSTSCASMRMDGKTSLPGNRGHPPTSRRPSTHQPPGHPPGMWRRRHRARCLSRQGRPGSRRTPGGRATTPARRVVSGRRQPLPGTRSGADALPPGQARLRAGAANRCRSAERCRRAATQPGAS